MTPLTCLANRRILVVEDHMLIAVLIEEALQELDCIVVGPVSKMETALHLANSEALDAAVLDVNIRGGHAYEVAERLRTRGVPFLLTSVYADWALPAAFRGRQRLNKPFTREDIKTQMRLLCDGRGRIGRTPRCVEDRGFHDYGS